MNPAVAGPSAAAELRPTVPEPPLGVEDIVMGAIPGLPKVVPHWPLVDYQVGDDFIQWF